MMQNIKIKLIMLPGGRLVWSMLNLFGRSSFLSKSGWLKSITKNQSIDKEGNPIPWIVYSCTYFLEPRINKNLKVFEFGSGNSTLWWAPRVKSVISVEYDKKWMGIVAQKAPKNVKLVFSSLEGKEYEESVIKQKTLFDIIMIDGRKRHESTNFALKALSKNGVIVFDNAERERYNGAIKLLENNNFKKLEFRGPLPISHKSDLTIIFYKKDNVLGI